MKAVVAKRISFDAAHFLPNHPGVCSRLHGHCWTIEVGIEGVIDKETGMVVDFKWLKAAMESAIEGFDHSCLNESGLLVDPPIALPTAENIAEHIRYHIEEEWIHGPEENLRVKFVKVWESPDSYAEV